MGCKKICGKCFLKIVLTAKNSPPPVSDPLLRNWLNACKCGFEFFFFFKNILDVFVQAVGSNAAGLRF